MQLSNYVYMGYGLDIPGTCPGNQSFDWSSFSCRPDCGSGMVDKLDPSNVGCMPICPPGEAYSRSEKTCGPCRFGWQVVHPEDQVCGCPTGQVVTGAPGNGGAITGCASNPCQGDAYPVNTPDDGRPWLGGGYSCKRYDDFSSSGNALLVSPPAPPPAIPVDPIGPIGPSPAPATAPQEPSTSQPVPASSGVAVLLAVAAVGIGLYFLVKKENA